jgi:hypothetical protein
MSDQNLVASIEGIWNSLMTKKAFEILRYFCDDATVFWGPYSFNGKKEIMDWAEGLLELFPSFEYEIHNLSVRGGKAIHVLVLKSIFKDGRSGLLPCICDYEFETEKIINAKFSLSYGYIS